MNDRPDLPAPPPDTRQKGGAQISFFTLFPSIMLPMFLAIIDQTIVATALPAIAAYLGDAEHVAWVVVSYLVAATSAAPAFGRLGDQFGRRRLMFIALAIFVTASILCALSTSMTMLVTSRVLQGIGGGGLMTLSQALIGETIAPRERARYQGYLAAIAVTSSTFGPVAGGFLTDNLGWQSIFLVGAPIELVAALLLLRIPPQTGIGGTFRFDVLGLLLFVVLVASVLATVQKVQHFASNALEIAVLLALSLVALLLLGWREKRASHPLLPLPLLANASIWRSDALAACHGATLVSLLTFLPIYLRVVHGASPAETGLLVLPMTLGIGLGSMTTGRMVSRTGRTAIFPSIGMVVVTLMLIGVAIYAEVLTPIQLALLLGLIAIFMGSVMSVVQVTVQSAAGRQMLGAAAATVQFSRTLGAALGTAIVGVVLFSAIAAADAETAQLFGRMIQSGPDILLSLAAERQVAIQVEIAAAFRGAFLTMATFTAIGCLLAWSMPIRRI